MSSHKRRNRQGLAAPGKQAHGRRDQAGDKAKRSGKNDQGGKRPRKP